MNLDAKEERMLLGKEGAGKQKSMEILYAVGEAMGAKRMAKIALAHILPPDLMFFPYGKRGEWGKQISNDLLQEVDRFVVPTSTEPRWMEVSGAKALEFPKEIIESLEEVQEGAVKRYVQLGAMPTWSAITFYDHPVAFGQHVAVAESCAIPYYAAVYGARCDRDNSATTIACAITGVTPEFGCHLKENRFGEVVVKIKDDLKLKKQRFIDYDAMSFYATRKLKGRKPIFVNLPLPVTMTQLKYIVSPLGVGAGVPMMHIVGATPEAPTLDAALGGNKPIDEIEVGLSEAESVFQTLRTAQEDRVDWVVFGCPHMSVEELRQIAASLSGKKVKKSVKLVVSTYRPFYETALEMGYIDPIREAGGIVILDSCVGFSASILKGNVATNSAKAAYFLHGYSKGEIKLLYGSLSDCLNAAVTGKWQAKGVL